MKKNFIIFLLAILTLGVWFSNFYHSPTLKLQKINESYIEVSSDKSENPEVQVSRDPKEGTLVIRVIDGDTIEIEGGQKVRYIGIDTPETSHPTKGLECFGRQATARNRDLVEGKRVRLEKDVSETDKYGRLLRYIFSGENLVNETLVREGFAYSSTYPPDVKYQERFLAAQREAESKNAGLWGSCDNVAGSNDPDDCRIKGNISSSGERIYHLPGQRYYNQTVISESKGEQWFCSEKEAKEAGWRRSRV